MEMCIQSFGTEPLQTLTPNTANLKAPAVTP